MSRGLNVNEEGLFVYVFLAVSVALAAGLALHNYQSTLTEGRLERDRCAAKRTATISKILLLPAPEMIPISAP